MAKIFPALLILIASLTPAAGPLVAIDGFQFEKEMHRTGGEMNSVIRFTKTAINPSIDASFFTIQ